ncbi:hypothetical protein B0H17DRAFT_955911, partial [Mycena rosella]
MNGNPPQPPPQPPIQLTRKYKKTPAPLPIPSIESIRARGSASTPSTPVTPAPSSASSQVSLRATRRSPWQKIDDVLKTWGFRSLGDFLAALFHPRTRGQKDPRSKTHRQVVSAFLKGRSTRSMADIIPLIYNHHASRPKKSDAYQRSASFSPYKPLSDIRYAQPCLSAWATRLVGDRTYFPLRTEGKSRRHLRATTNGRRKDTDVVEWEDVKFTMDGLAKQYQEEDEFLWYLTECFTASRKKGKVVVKKTRPHSVIQVGAIGSFITSRNRYASGDLGLPLGLWLFACQAHTDIKRILCRFGYSVSDSTARHALNTLTESSLNDLKAKVRDAIDRGEAEWGKVSDNVQKYAKVYEHGLGLQNELKHGTACTAFRFDNCKPGAFNADDHIARVIKQERQTMTAETVYGSIDWTHNDNITDLHFVRALSTNAEQQIQNKGYQAGFFDFDEQMGIEPDKCDNILSWNRGDGATHAALKRIKLIQATIPSIYCSFRNALSTPETWHTKATDLNSCASNHYGPSASPDPSSLSRSSNAANMKRPSDLKKCDFYPTSRSMTLIWEARVLDCWRLVLGCDSDLLTHFEKDCLPTFDELLQQASIIRERYASQMAYEQSLDKTEQDDAPDRTKFPEGSPWTPTKASEPPAAQPDADVHMPAARPESAADEDGPKMHKEPPGFNGDRVLSNAILFLMEFGWWVELNYAIPEGDVGRVLEIFKVFDSILAV